MTYQKGKFDWNGGIDPEEQDKGFVMGLLLTFCFLFVLWYFLH